MAPLPPPRAAAAATETSALLPRAMETNEELTSKLSPPESATGGVSRGRGRCCVRYGRTWVLCSLSRRYGLFPRTCHVGPHWGFMLVTYCVALGPAFLFLVHGDLLLGFQIVLLVSMAVTTASFTMVACSDPGVIFEDYSPASVQEISDVERGIICAQCEIRRPLTASHCADCGVCVNELDHHCPWTGKCVGKRTLRWFYVFLSCISVHVVLVGVIVCVTFVSR